ncbi:Arc family DNA-binding protein [Propionibacteriaceae bacterium Y1700]|uniref:Arc family DNA-binding protein n=1 Tax=Microlunatus sp. Y1700 TaxID=3418487 RepID=UPI003DA78921
MNIDTYLESVRGGISNATALADDHSKDVAHRLGDAVESSVRLALIEALSDATAEISAEVAPASVEFRLTGGEPQFVVSAPPATADEQDDYDDDVTNDATESGGDDEEQVRVTLRLPASIKKKVDEQADADGVSTNTWLLQRVLESLGRRGRGGRGGPWRGGPPEPPSPPFGPTFGPDFPFGSGGPFGPGGPFGGDERRHGRGRDERRREDRGSRGTRRGWVQ